VVTWCGQAYFVARVRRGAAASEDLKLVDPRCFARELHGNWDSQGCLRPEFIRLPHPPILMGRGPEELQEHADAKQAYEEELAEFRAQLAHADDQTAEAARAAADAAFAACSAPPPAAACARATAPEHEPEELMPAPE
jgi:hypothetical protein